MGGRGSASGKGGGAANSKSSWQNMNTKFTSKQISSMSRSQLETVAKAIYIKVNMARGKSESEALYSATGLMPGNTDAQLRKYIKRYG